MKLNADIIYNDLQKVLDVSFNGDKLKELVLQRPEFYIDNTAVFQSNHVYVCSADHLPEDPSVEDNVLLVCLGKNTPPAFFYSGCSIISVPPEEDIFHVFNLVQTVFNKYETWEETVNGIIRTNASLQEMLDASRSVFDNPLLLIGSDFNYLAYTDKDYLQNDLGIDFSGSNFDPELLAEFLTMHEIATNIKEPILLGLKGRSTLSINIFESDEYLGCLTVFGEFRDIRPSDIQLCMYFSELLRQALQLNPSMAGTRSAYRQVLKHLVDGQPISSEARAVISKHNDHRAKLCMCLNYKGDSQLMPKGYLSSLIEQQIPGSMAFTYDDQIIAIVSVNETEYKNDAASRAFPILEKNHLSCGISQTFPDLYDSAYALFQASSALKQGSKQHPDKRLFFYEDYILPQLFTGAKGMIPAKYYQTDGLKRLYAHDASSSVSYIETLKTFLDNNMSISATAKALYLHRSSLIDRLDHVTRLLGSDLDDPAERLKLQFILHMSETSE